MQMQWPWQGNNGSGLCSANSRAGPRQSGGNLGTLSQTFYPHCGPCCAEEQRQAILAVVFAKQAAGTTPASAFGTSVGPWKYWKASATAISGTGAAISCKLAV